MFNRVYVTHSPRCKYFNFLSIMNLAISIISQDWIWSVKWSCTQYIQSVEVKICVSSHYSAFSIIFVIYLFFSCYWYYQCYCLFSFIYIFTLSCLVSVFLLIFVFPCTFYIPKLMYSSELSNAHEYHYGFKRLLGKCLYRV